MANSGYSLYLVCFIYASSLFSMWKIHEWNTHSIIQQIFTGWLFCVWHNSKRLGYISKHSRNPCPQGTYVLVGVTLNSNYSNRDRGNSESWPRGDGGNYNYIHALSARPHWGSIWCLLSVNVKNSQTSRCKLIQSWRLRCKHLLNSLNALHIKNDKEIV